MPDQLVTPSSRRRLSYRWELLAWMWVAFFFNQADRQIFGTVLPQLKVDLRITDVQAGLIATLFTVALAVTVPFAGYIGDACNRARVVTIAVFAWSVATLISGFGSSLAFLILIRSIATGVGEAFYAPAANALIAEHHHETRARAMALHQTSLYAGVIASGWLAGWLADRLGWRSAFWVFGGCGMVLAIGLALRLHSGRSPRPANVAPSLRDALRVLCRPTVLLLTAAFACMVSVNIGYLTWMPTYLHEQFGLNLAKAGFTSMVFHHIGAFAGVALGGGLSDRLGGAQPVMRLALQVAALLAGAPFIWMLGTATTLTGLFAALAVFGVFRGVYDAGIYASLFEVIAPRLRATVVGLIIALAYLVGAVAPVGLGLLKGGMGLAAGFSLLAMVYVAGGALILVAQRWYFQRDRNDAFVS